MFNVLNNQMYCVFCYGLKNGYVIEKEESVWDV